MLSRRHGPGRRARVPEDVPLGPEVSVDGGDSPLQSGEGPVGGDGDGHHGALRRRGGAARVVVVHGLGGHGGAR